MKTHNTELNTKINEMSELVEKRNTEAFEF